MRIAAMGGLLVAGLATVVFGAAMGQDPNQAQGNHRQAVGSNDGLIVLKVTESERQAQIAVIDPESRSLAIYHVDPASGEIELMSVRNIFWDLRVDAFNAAAPLPQEIRAMLQER